MGAFGTFLVNKILNCYFGATAYAAPATLYIALSTADPTADASGLTEPVGNGYERLAITNNKTNWDTSIAGALDNDTEFTFAAASGAWGHVTHFAIMAADAPSTDMLGYGELSVHKDVTDGDTVYFDVGNLDITLA